MFLMLGVEGVPETGGRATESYGPHGGQTGRRDNEADRRG